MKKVFKAVLPIILIIGILLSCVSVNAVTFKSFPKNPEYSYGVDVSEWNGDIDCNYLRNIRVECAYFRGGYYKHGGGYVDERFKQNVRGCVEAGIDFGIYVYSYIYSYTDSVKMANWVHRQLKSLGNYTKDRDTIQVAYDIEDAIQSNAVNSGRITRNYLHNGVKKFCNKIRDYGYIPTIYSSQSFYRDLLNLEDYLDNDFYIWYAQWPYYPDPTEKKVMFNDKSPHIWQFSENYTIKGMRYDSNALYEDFYDYSREDSQLYAANLKSSGYTFKKLGVKPSFQIYDGDTLLKEGTDYKIYYYKNKKVGIARAKVVRFKNKKYIESKTIKYAIKPQPVTNLKATPSYDEIELKWDKVAGATSYQIYEHNDSFIGYNLIDEVKTNSYTDFFLDEGTEYKLKVRPVMTVDGKRYYGNSVALTASTTYCPVQLGNVSSREEGAATVNWKSKTENTRGYVIEFADNAQFKNKTRYVVRGINKSLSDISGCFKSGQKVYFRIRSYNVVNGKYVYSDYSSVRSVKIK